VKKKLQVPEGRRKTLEKRKLKHRVYEDSFPRQGTGFYILMGKRGCKKKRKVGKREKWRGGSCKVLNEEVPGRDGAILI